MGVSPVSLTVDSRADVNQDGVVSPIDALLVLNGVNNQIQLTPTFDASLDVNGDSHVTSIDALLVINRLGTNATAVAEGEPSELVRRETDLSAASLPENTEENEEVESSTLRADPPSHQGCLEEQHNNLNGESRVDGSDRRAIDRHWQRWRMHEDFEETVSELADDLTRWTESARRRHRGRTSR